MTGRTAPPPSVARVNDLDIAYRLEGHLDAPVVMLVHGLLADHTMWDRLVPCLLPHFRVLRYDLRGHGRTTVTPAPYRFEQLAADGVGLMDALGLDRVHFIGTSLGGMLGQHVGAKHGERLLTLTLANTGASQPSPQGWDERIASACSAGVSVVAEGTLQRWFTSQAAQAMPDVLRSMRQVLCGTALEGFVGGAQAVRDLAQLHLLADIKVPVLIISGAQDMATPPALSLEIQRGIAGAALHTLDAAHQSAVERPQEFFEAWFDFVRALESTTGRV